MSTGVICINPGSGPVADATEENATANMVHYLADCGVDGLECVRIATKDYGEGRFAFLVWKDTTCHEVQMPGLPLEAVRFTGAEDQNIWHYPRLYVDGSSWVWKYAVFDEESDWVGEEK